MLTYNGGVGSLPDAVPVHKETTMTLSHPPSITHFEELSLRYDFFLFDLWGVIHNGKQAFPGAIETLTRLKELKKRVYFLSNAPRRPDAAIQQLNERGVPRDLYAHVFTSGEDCFEGLRDRSIPFYQALGEKLYHLGPEKDRNIFISLPNYRETIFEEADFILNTGTYSFSDTLDSYEPLLMRAREGELPMICANPDLFVLYGDSFALCAGKIAERYHSMGGFVYYHGKPYPDLYLKIFDRFKVTDLSSVLMIGDSLKTDIKGANNVGINSLFIQNGIHSQLPDGEPNSFQTYGAMPTYVMEKVTW